MVERLQNDILNKMNIIENYKNNLNQRNQLIGFHENDEHKDDEKNDVTINVKQRLFNLENEIKEFMGVYTKHKLLEIYNKSPELLITRKDIKKIQETMQIFDKQLNYSLRECYIGSL